MPIRLRTAVLGALLLLASGADASALDFNSETITGTVELPEDQTHRFYHTITLDDAVVNNYGYLRNENAPVTVTGAGQINLFYSGGIEGIWTDGWVDSFLTIDSEIEVLARYDTHFSSTGINKGIIAAVPGDDYGTAVNSIDTLVSLDNFINEGLIEVRPAGIMRLVLRDQLFQNTGTLRVQPTGELRVVVNQSEPLTPQAMGNLENNGLTTFQAYIEGTGDLNLNGDGVYEFDRYSAITGSTLNIAPTATARVISTPSNVFRLSGTTVNGNLESKYLSDTLVEGGLELNGQWDFGQAEVIFRGPQTIAGNAEFVSHIGIGTLRAIGDGVVTFGPTTKLRVEPGATLALSGSAQANFLLQGTTDIDGGRLSGNFLNNAGAIHAYNGGFLDWGYSSGNLINTGTIQVDSGAILELGATLDNQGQIVVDNANVILESMPQGTGTISITDSTIYAAAYQQTLSQLLTLPRVRSEIVTAASYYGDQVDLEGATLTVADVDNERWAMAGGGFQNGTIESADGFELRTVAPLAGSNDLPLLRNVVLNADLRVTAQRDLQVNQGVTGAGKIILDNGRVQINGRGNQGAPMTSEVLAMIEPDMSASENVVSIYGPLDNAGRTIYLKAGADWQLDVLRSDGIVGGRIEGDPGVELNVVRSYHYGDLRGVTFAAPLRIGTSSVYISDGLTLDGSVVHIGGPTTGLNNVQIHDARLNFGGTQTLGGAGEVRFERFQDSPPGERQVLSQAGTLTIEEGITVRTWTSDGLIGGDRDSMDPVSGASLVNQGLLLAESGHTLTIVASDFQQLGTLRAGVDSTLVVHADLLPNEGQLLLTGGEMTFSGDLSQTPSATMTFELAEALIDGTTQVEVGGELSLDGLLEVILGVDYVPQWGDSFALATAADSILGDFQQTQLPELAEDLFWQLDNDGQSLALNVASSSLTGDFNSDGQVAGHDFLAWQRGEVGAPPTGNNLQLWQDNYGNTASGPAVAALSEPVPEPATAAALLLAIALFSVRRSPPAGRFGKNS